MLTPDPLQTDRPSRPLLSRHIQHTSPNTTPCARVFFEKSVTALAGLLLRNVLCMSVNFVPSTHPFPVPRSSFLAPHPLPHDMDVDVDDENAQLWQSGSPGPTHSSNQPEPTECDDYWFVGRQIQVACKVNA